jgi:hypothetical protein
MEIERIGLQDFHTLLHLWDEVLVLEPWQIWERKEHIMHTILVGDITRFPWKQTDAFIWIPNVCIIWIPELWVWGQVGEANHKQMYVSSEFQNTNITGYSTANIQWREW